MRGRRTKFSTRDQFKGKDAKPAWVREGTGAILHHLPGDAEYTMALRDDPYTVTFVLSNGIEPTESAKDQSSS